MSTLMRRDPFRELDSLRSMMDQLVESTFSAPGMNFQPHWELALDVVETPDEYIVKASVPGINPDDLEMTFNDKTLTLRGEVKGEKVDEKATYHLRERWSGNFSRSVTLPTRVKSDDIKATYDAGVLTLKLPKTEEVKPKRIAVHSGQGMIEGRVKQAKN